MSKLRVDEIESIGTGAVVPVSRIVVAVDSIADLLALPEGQRKEGLRYLVKGYHAGSDVGGGEFYWDPERVDENDGGTVFAPASDSAGRWVRQLDGFVTPNMFGARGDGVADDTDKFNLAAASANGGDVLVSGGSFTLTADTATASWHINKTASINDVSKLKGIVFHNDGIRSDYGLNQGGRWTSDANRAKIHRFRDRVFIGASAENSGGISANTGKHSWLDDPAVTKLVPGNASLEQNATLAVAAESGLTAILGATRSSLYPHSTGSNIGLAGVSINDTISATSRKGALAAYLVSILSSDSDLPVGASLTGMESNIWNQKADADPLHPYGFFPKDSVKNLWLSNGFPENEHTSQSFEATCAIGILNNVIDTTTGKYKAGIAFKDTALSGTDGISGRGIALSLARGHSFQWYYGTGAQGPHINSSVDSNANEVQALDFTNFGLQVKNASTNKVHLLVASSPSIANYVRLAPSAAGAPVRYMVDGEDANIDLQLNPKGVGDTKAGGNFKGLTDNSKSLGTPGVRWSVVYAGTGTINTSDEREKTELLDYEVSERSAALEIKQHIRKFKFIDAVDKKGDKARIHFGVGAQTVKSILESHRLNPFDYAFLCYDEWEELPEIKETVDDKEVVVQEYRAAGNRYGIRYDELAMFILGAL